jgi:hypothetical protein
MISAGNGPMLVYCAAVVIVKKYTMVVLPPQTHNSFPGVKSNPKRVALVHRDFFLRKKVHERAGRVPGPFDNALYVLIGYTDNRFAAAISASRTAEL